MLLRYLWDAVSESSYLPVQRYSLVEEWLENDNFIPRFYKRHKRTENSFQSLSVDIVARN